MRGARAPASLSADMLELLRQSGSARAGGARCAGAQGGLRGGGSDGGTGQPPGRSHSDHYRRAGRQHPHVADEAAAFADTIIPLFGHDTAAFAVHHADSRGAASERLAETELSWGRARRRLSAVSASRRAVDAPPLLTR